MIQRQRRWHKRHLDRYALQTVQVSSDPMSEATTEVKDAAETQVSAVDL